MSEDGSAYRLAVVGAGRVRGQIAMVACPGRTSGILLPSNSAWRLQRDVATLMHWGAQALVTLLDKSELTWLRLGDLPALLSTHHIAWYHLPLRVGCMPDERFESAWSALGSQLRATLWCGGRLAIHCVDGRSRTALVAAKLLVELGCPASDALNRVRGARPGVLNLPEEEQFVRRQTQASDAAYRSSLSLVQHRALPTAPLGTTVAEAEWIAPEGTDQLAHVQRP